MNIFKNILVIQKTSKLKYLIEKYGIDACKKSSEYNLLRESMDNHERNCDNFVDNLQQNINKDQNIKIINDNFMKNEIISGSFNDRNLILSMGGDGTFLRCSYFIDSNDFTLIGINTDKTNSKGFYCAFHAEEFVDEKKINIKKIIENQFSVKYLNKLEIEIKDRKFHFLNDLYFGEKFMGRISKYKLEVDDEQPQVIKSSGIIFSTCK